MPAKVDSPASPQLTRDTFSQALIDSLIESLPSDETRRSYRRSIDDFFAFAGRRTITRDLVHGWRTALAKKMNPASVNTRLAAMRSLFREARRTDAVTHEQAWQLLDVRGLRTLGYATGNWLSRDQVRALLAQPNRRTLTGKRNYCALAILIGCALRRTEAIELQLEQLQMRDGRWVFANLRGKGGRLRTVAVPVWVKEAIDAWTKIGAITSGPILRPVSLKKQPLSTEAVWKIVSRAAHAVGIASVSPHDLRRTCARLARSRGADYDQLQEMLGHSSVVTTQKYVRAAQNLRQAPNDDLGIWSS